MEFPRTLTDEEWDILRKELLLSGYRIQQTSNFKPYKAYGFVVAIIDREEDVVVQLYRRRGDRWVSTKSGQSVAWEDLHE